MAIVKMKEFSLCFLKDDKEKILCELQDFGGLEFRDFEKYVENERYEEVFKGFDYLKSTNQDIFNEQSLSKLRYCLDVLRPYVSKIPMIKSLTGDKLELYYDELKKLVVSSNWEKLYDSFKDISLKISTLESDYTKCIADINSSKVWENLKGNVSDYYKFDYVKCVLGSISKQFELDITKTFDEKFDLCSVQVVNSSDQEVFFVIVVHNDVEQEAFNFLKSKGFNFCSLSYDGEVMEHLRSLENKKNYILRTKQELENELKSYASKYSDLQIVYEYFNSSALKNNVSQSFLSSDSILICRGYVEEENIKNFEDCLKESVGLNFYLEFKDIDLEDSVDVPVKLSNSSIVSPFESVLEMYSYPSYREVDPTPIISVFFVVFFGMMLADAGYGFIITLISVILYFKSKTYEKKNSYRLFIFTGISTIIWGVIYGAYFGDFIQRYFGINVPVLLDVNKDIMTIFVISIAFGFVHLVFGLIMKAIVYFKNGRKVEVIYDVVPWLLVLAGVLVFALNGVLLIFTPTVATSLICIGILILLFTQGRDSETLVGKIGGGVYGVYGITSYVGDIISYSRLLALGLASGFIANAFNILGGLIPFPLNIVITPLMLIPLHIFNLGINALGTYIHSARLQYLEFFGKFYSGGGKKFDPFKYTDEYIRIKSKK